MRRNVSWRVIETLIVLSVCAVMSGFQALGMGRPDRGIFAAYGFTAAGVLAVISTSAVVWNRRG